VRQPRGRLDVAREIFRDEAQALVGRRRLPARAGHRVACRDERSQEAAADETAVARDQYVHRESATRKRNWARLALSSRMWRRAYTLE
jgi:hypothetical protein